LPAPLFIQADRWFDRSRAALLNELPCRQGCCRCCIGPFAITLLDVAELQRGLASLDRESRQDIVQQAEQQARLMESAYVGLQKSAFIDDWDDEDVDALVSQFADLPCPALSEDGRCRVYESRPMTCRMMGIPVSEAEGQTHGACEVQTAVPIRPLSRSLREEVDRLAEKEAAAIEEISRRRPEETEMLLPYGFLPSPA
jgi:Fe-S-cluster containining protein